MAPTAEAQPREPIGSPEDVLRKMKSRSLNLTTSDFTTISIEHDKAQANTKMENTLRNSELQAEGTLGKNMATRSSFNNHTTDTKGISVGAECSKLTVSMPSESEKSMVKKSENDTKLVENIDNSAQQLGSVITQHKGNNSADINDDISDIAIDRSIHNQTKDDTGESISLCDYDDKLSKEKAALKKLIHSSSGRSCVSVTCKPKEKLSSSLHSTLNVCGWFEGQSETETKAKSTVTKRRPSPAVFQRLSREGKDRHFVFKHHADTSSYMDEYRSSFTIGSVGDRTREPPLIGRDVPDPYATKPSNVCLVTEMYGGLSPPMVGLAGGKKLTDDHSKHGSRKHYVNLSPVRPQNTPCPPDEDSSIPSKSVINVNDLIDVPKACSQRELRPSSSISNMSLNNGTKMASSNTPFSGEIVGVKHRLPIATACNISALCKPSAGSDVYGNRKNIQIISRKSNNFKNPPKKIPKTEPMRNPEPEVKGEMDEFDCDTNLRNQSNFGCRGCTRITSLLRGTKKSIRRNAKDRDTLLGQCKPINTFYRLQKLSIGPIG